MNKITKIFKYLFVSVAIAFVLFAILEIISFSLKLSVLFKEGCFDNKTKIECIKGIYEYYTGIYKNINNSPIDINEMRKPIIKHNNNGSIILLGCSFTYGYRLGENGTFGAVLSDYTNKSVYNWGISSTSPREILYILQNKNLISKLIQDRNNVEYVIYTYIPDHIFRLYYNLLELSPIYKLKNNSELVYKKNSLYNATFFSREMQKIAYFLSSDKDKNKLFSAYMSEINKEITKTFKYKDKDTKFIIFVFFPENISDWDAISNLDDNIIVVKLSDLIDIDILSEEYIISKDDIHPNTEAWKLIVPKLINYLDSINNSNRE